MPPWRSSCRCRASRTIDTDTNGLPVPLARQENYFKINARIPLAVPPWQRHDAATFAELRAWWQRAPDEVLANYTARRQHTEALLARAPPGQRFI
eukprot:gene50458-68605_t